MANNMQLHVDLSRPLATEFIFFHLDDALVVLHDYGKSSFSALS